MILLIWNIQTLGCTVHICVWGQAIFYSTVAPERNKLLLSQGESYCQVYNAKWKRGGGTWYLEC